MEKIKITKEQEEALRQWRKINQPVEKMFSNYIEQRADWNHHLKPLSEINSDDMAKILLGHYEIEQPFKVGDWVYCKKHNSYYKIARITNGEYEIKLSNEELEANFLRQHLNMYEKWEKVTEPWKIMLLELGREKPELRVGDIYIGVSGGVHVIDEEIAHERILDFKEELVVSFHPVESSVKLEVKQIQ